MYNDLMQKYKEIRSLTWSMKCLQILIKMNADILYTQICAYAQISRDEFELFFNLFYLKKGEFHYIADKALTWKSWGFFV